MPAMHCLPNEGLQSKISNGKDSDYRVLLVESFVVGYRVRGAGNGAKSDMTREGLMMVFVESSGLMTVNGSR